MKNNTGFTLAEVLLTLTVVGVVAALVIPPVVKHHQKEEWISRYKDTYNIISQATKMVQAQYETDNLPVYLSVFNGTDISDSIRFFQAYEPYLRIIKNCGAHTNGSSPDPCFADSYKILEGTPEDPESVSTSGYSVILASGASLRFYNADARYLTITVDTNGKKSPNTYGKDYFIFISRGDGIANNPNNFKPEGWYWDSSTINTLCPDALNSENGRSCGVRIMQGDYGTAY